MSENSQPPELNSEPVAELPPINENPLDTIFKPAGQIFLGFLLLMSFFVASKSLFASAIAPPKKPQPEFAEALQAQPINALTLMLSTLTFLSLGAMIVTVLKRRNRSHAPETLAKRWSKAPAAATGLLVFLLLWVGTQLFTTPVVSFIVPAAFSSNTPTLTEAKEEGSYEVKKSEPFFLSNISAPGVVEATIRDPKVDETKKSSQSFIESRYAAGYVLFPRKEDPVSVNKEDLPKARSLQHGDTIHYKGRSFRFEHVIKDPKAKLSGSALSKLLVTLLLVCLVALVSMSKSSGTKIEFESQGLTREGILGEIARGARLYFAFLPVIVALVGGTNVLAEWLGLNQVPHPIQSFLEDFDSTALILAFLTAVIGAPIQEELMFRGLLMPALGKLVSLPLAILISAWFFASMHVGFHSILPIFGLGVFFGYLTASAPRRSIWASMTAHMIHNSLALGLFLAVHHVTST